MLEKFTVDILSEQVATLLLEGEPTPKLTYRFFRKGRRDGRRAYDHDSVAKMLEDAVHLAGSTLVEQLVAERHQAELRIRSLEASLAANRGRASGAAAPSPAPGAAVASAVGAGESGSQRALADALANRKRLVEQRAAERAATEIREAEAELAQVRRRQELLPSEYAQRFDSIRHTGELLWSRYCNGFVQGESRRGSRSSDVEVPVGSLRIQPPAPLQWRDPSTATAPAVPLKQGA